MFQDAVKPRFVACFIDIHLSDSQLFFFFFGYLNIICRDRPMNVARPIDRQGSERG